MALLTLILKTTLLLERLNFDKLEISDGKISIGGNDNGIEYTKKSEKLKAQKLSKSRKLAKSEIFFQKVGIYQILMLRKIDQAF